MKFGEDWASSFGKKDFEDVFFCLFIIIFLFCLLYHRHYEG